MSTAIVIEGWEFTDSGAPACQLMGPREGLVAARIASISWTPSHALVFEHDDPDASEVRVPVAVLQELMRRAEAWHWQPPCGSAHEHHWRPYALGIGGRKCTVCGVVEEDKS